MLARIGLGKVALAVSVIVHAGIAVAVARHPSVAVATALPLAEVAAPDLLPIEPEVPTPREQEPEPEAAPHTATPVAGRTAPRAPLATPDVGSSDPAPAPSVIAAPEPSPPHFTMLVAATTRVVSGTTAVNAHAASVGSFSEAALAESAVDVPAKLRAGTPPRYTEQALDAGIESDVPLELVIDAAGVVVSARGLVHVGYGLDEAARASVQSYRFSPAERGGHAVAVRMRWVMRFQLR